MRSSESVYITLRHGQKGCTCPHFFPTGFGLIDPKYGGEKRVRTKREKERVKKRVSTMINEAPGVEVSALSG